MRYVAAYMLAVLGGNENPTADDVRTIIESVGVEVDESSMKILLDKLKGKDIDAVQKLGLARLETVSGMSKSAEERLETIPPVDEQKSKNVEKSEDVDADDDDDDSDDGGGIGNLFG